MEHIGHLARNVGKAMLEQGKSLLVQHLIPDGPIASASGKEESEGQAS